MNSASMGPPHVWDHGGIPWLCMPPQTWTHGVCLPRATFLAVGHICQPSDAWSESHALQPTMRAIQEVCRMEDRLTKLVCMEITMNRQGDPAPNLETNPKRGSEFGFTTFEYPLHPDTKRLIQERNRDRTASPLQHTTQMPAQPSISSFTEDPARARRTSCSTPTGN